MLEVPKNYVPSTAFKKGECRALSIENSPFKPGNYRGYPSREAWSANFKYKMADIKTRVQARKRNSKAIKELREIQDEARKLAPLAIQTMKRVMKSKTASDMALLTAADKVLDRAYGKAMQTNINANVDSNAKPTEVTAAELDKRIEETLARIERLTKREAEEGESEERPADLREYH
jgi:hypothetical protein